MPNWCQNYLTVDGPAEALARLDSLLRTPVQVVDFERILPIPPEHKPPSEGWYGWCIDNWGTPWNVGENPALSTARWEPGSRCVFTTAWVPPILLVDHLSTLFPQVQFTLLFGEAVDCVAGMNVWSGGELDSEESYEEDCGELRAFLSDQTELEWMLSHLESRDSGHSALDNMTDDEV